MNRNITRQSFIDGPNVTWTDILRSRSNRARLNAIESKLAIVEDPLERALLESELKLLREEDQDYEML